MSPQNINSTVNNFVRDNLSPKPTQREYISEKYAELKGFLGNSCFQAGSYARYTAIDPVHDLDVIYPIQDASVQQNPARLINALRVNLIEQYKGSPTQVKEITAQTHSVTIMFSDSPEGDFSVDVVPAVELAEKNNYGQPLYSVPEILRMNHRKRARRYDNSSVNPIGWIKSDPRGYTKAASDLNDTNSDFRHATKLIKGWRHACKVAYGGDFKLKSFHLEQIVRLHFEANPQTTTVEALVGCLSTLPSYMAKPQIADRADRSQLIDQYIAELTKPELDLILQLQSKATHVANQVVSSQSAAEVVEVLHELLTIEKPRPSTPPPRPVTPQQPWAL